MSVFVRCTRCAYRAKSCGQDDAGTCPVCGSRLEVTTAGVQSGLASSASSADASASASPKSRMLARIERIPLDSGDAASAMRQAIRDCIDEIRDGSRNHAGEIGALLDAGRSYAVASFGIWNELRSRSEALEANAFERTRAEVAADEALCAGDAGVLAVIRAIDGICSLGQRLEEIELEALQNLWQTVHDFDRYPLATLRMNCLRRGYGLCDGEAELNDVDPERDRLAAYDIYECAEGGNAECLLSISERVLRVQPDNGYAAIMAGVAREVIACDTVVATTHFHDLDEAVREHVVALRGEPLKWSVPALADEPAEDGREEPQAPWSEQDFTVEDLLAYLGGADAGEMGDYEIDEDVLDKRSQGLRDLARSLECMLTGIVDHTRRVIAGCEAHATDLTDEVVARVRAQHDDAAGALSAWLRMILHDLVDLLWLGYQFEEDWEYAVWKHLFLAVPEADRDRFWHQDYACLRSAFEELVEDLEHQEAGLHHRIVDVELALERKMREIDRALMGDAAVLERLRAEASMLQYEVGMLAISLEYVQDCFESRDWDELGDDDM